MVLKILSPRNIMQIDVESTGAILRVKVSYASEIHQDERVWGNESDIQAQAGMHYSGF